VPSVANTAIMGPYQLDGRAATLEAQARAAIINHSEGDVTPLRGIAGTAPYFHDNSHETLKDVIDSYSRFILSALTPLQLPRVNPPESPDGAPEALSVQQKHDLLAFLQRL
jgi:cytochrome c peroxidase